LIRFSAKANVFAYIVYMYNLELIKNKLYILYKVIGMEKLFYSLPQKKQSKKNYAISVYFRILASDHLNHIKKKIKQIK
jgi:hypothetical protein